MFHPTPQRLKRGGNFFRGETFPKRGPPKINPLWPPQKLKPNKDLGKRKRVLKFKGNHHKPREI